LTVTLASKSAIRAEVLTNAGVPFTAVGSGVDEDAVKAAMLADGQGPRAIAEALGELKAVKVSQKVAGLVIGADQTLDLDGQLLDKVETAEAGLERLKQLRGRTHKLHGGVVVARDGAAIWREVATSTLTMRDFSDDFLDAYWAQEKDKALGSVGCYRYEGPGVQLFSRIEGDYFDILGLPLLGLLDLLRRHGEIAA
jgi:septum formation protein